MIICNKKHIVNILTWGSFPNLRIRLSSLILIPLTIWKMVNLCSLMEQKDLNLWRSSAVAKSGNVKKYCQWISGISVSAVFQRISVVCRLFLLSSVQYFYDNVFHLYFYHIEPEVAGMYSCYHEWVPRFDRVASLQSLYCDSVVLCPIFQFSICAFLSFKCQLYFTKRSNFYVKLLHFYLSKFVFYFSIFFIHICFCQSLLSLYCDSYMVFFSLVPR